MADRAVRRMSSTGERIAGAILALLPAASTTHAQPAAPAPPIDMASAAEALAAAPKVQIANGVLRATVLLPDAQRGFYRGTRFDWSGVISSVRLGGQEYYGLWFDKTAPNVRDFVFHQGEVVAGPNTAILGPAEAFDPNEIPSFDEAPAGGAFLKIGVGVLRKPADGAPYSSFRTYDFVDRGAWTSKAGRDRVAFTHTLSNAQTGFGYVYRKTVRLVPGKPQMVIEHSLKNTGSRPLATTTFNHNFLTLGGSPVGPGLTVETPFALSAARPPRGDAAGISGSRLVYSRALPDGETMSVQLAGFGRAAADNRITVASAAGAGFTVVGDRPLSGFTVWSIRPTICVEPFITVSAAPGETVTWSHTYTYAAPRGG